MQSLFARVRQWSSAPQAQADWSVQGTGFPFDCPEARTIGLEYRLSPQQLRELREIFNRLDVGCAGAVRSRELAALVGEQPRGTFFEYVKALAEAAGSDGSGRLDFFAWTRAMIELALLDEEGLTRIVFRMIDVDGDEMVCVQDLMHLGERLHPAAPLFDYFALDLGLRVPFERFFEQRELFPLLLFPAHELQSRVQAVLFGQSFWHKLAQKAREATKQGPEAAGEGPGARSAAGEAGRGVTREAGG